MSSDAERLRREINYLSVLIQQHKEGKKSSFNTRPKFPSQKRFQSGASNFTSKNVHYTPKQKRHYQYSNEYIPTKIQRPSTAPTPAMMAKATGVTFQSKFKWTKDKNNKVTEPRTKATQILKTAEKSPLNDAASSSKQVTQSTSKNVAFPKPNTSKVASNSSSTQQGLNIVKNTKYKYHKAAEPSKTLPINIIKSDKGDTSRTRQQQSANKISQSHLSRWSLKRSHTSPAKLPSITKWSTRQSSRYKINRGVKVSAVGLSRKKLLIKSPKLQNRRYSRSSRVVDRRNKIKSTSTHITLSKAALEGLLKKHAVTMKQVLASRAVAKSHRAAKSGKQEQRKQHCLYYGRFGKCMRGDSCKFIHDPSRISVCTRFLRGTCRVENCSFSHKVEKEKIPVCLFFLRGRCTVANCPYMHVYHGKDASVCRRFATTGFCPDADKCKMLHIKCCPEFYEAGNCPDGKSCKLSHLKIRKPSTKANPPLNKSDEPGTSKTGSDIDKTTSEQSSSCPDFLSLKVDSPQPINKPFKPTASILIKPRFGKLKAPNSSQ